jgi:hypothetical protein
MKGLKIEKNVPIPDRYADKREGTYCSYLRKMEVGDSIKFNAIQGARVRIVIGNYFHKISEKRFITRKEDEGIRVWRVKDQVTTVVINKNIKPIILTSCNTSISQQN